MRELCVRCRDLRWATAVIVTAAVMVCSRPAWAADREASRKVAEGNQALAAGKTDEALKLYEQAAEKAADAPEVAYNRGVAFYRKGDRTAAAEQFQKALSTRDIKLEARAKFNLGNCAYAEALAKQNELEKALEQLRLAISCYKDAIAADRNDLDAKINMETAQLFMKDLLDREKNKQEEQEKNPQSQPESQPESQPASQPESPQSRPASQPQSDEQKNEQQEQQQKDGQQKDPQQKDGEQQQQGQKQEEKQGEQKQGDKGEEQEGKKVEAQQQEGENSRQAEQNEKGEPGKPVETRVLHLTQEQAEKLLQKIRDREQQRREALLRLQRSQQVPVDKDW